MKGQTGVEFLETFSIAALIFLIFSALIFTQFSVFSAQDTSSAEAEATAKRIAKEIDYAYAAGDGYHSSFTFPKAIKGANYTVGIDEENRVVEIDVVEEIPEEEDSYGTATFLAPDTIISNISKEGKNFVHNSKGTVSVIGANSSE